MENLTSNNTSATPGGGEMQPQMQSIPRLSKRERRELRRKEKALLAEHVKKKVESKKILFFGISILIVALLGFGIFRYLFAPVKNGSVSADVLSTCVTHAGGMHIHPRLRIVINGMQEEIPANVGISSGCMRPLHTHDASGTIHVEFPRFHEFTLGDFFKIWGKSFSSAEILGSKEDATHIVTMTVNGAVNTEYERRILKDKEEIEIRYEEKK